MTADKLWIGYKGSDAELVRGMTLVATVLRKSLLEHAERIGCPCGSEEWLAERLLDANLHDEKGGVMSDEPRELPVIRWTPGMKVPLPEGHVPSYVEVGPGEVIDEALLRWILDALLDEHPEAERLRLVAATRPGLDAEPGELHGEPMVAARLVGEVIGYFDPRLLKA